jgi:hypothetical protein
MAEREFTADGGLHAASFPGDEESRGDPLQDQVISKKVAAWERRPIATAQASPFLKEAIWGLTITGTPLRCQGEHAMRIALHYLFTILVLTAYGGQV